MERSTLSVFFCIELTATKFVMAEQELEKIGQIYMELLKKSLYQHYRPTNEKSWWKSCLRTSLKALLFWYPFIFLILQLYSWFIITEYTERMLCIALVLNISSILIRIFTFVAKTEELESLFLNFKQFHCNVHRPGYAITELNKARALISRMNVGAIWFFAFNISNWFILPVIANMELFNLFSWQEFCYRRWVDTFPSLIFIRVPSPWTEIKYVYEVTDALWVNTFWEASGILYFAIAVLIATQYSILSEMVVRDETITGSAKQLMCLKYFVEDHKKLLKCCQQLEIHLRPILASQLATTGVLIGAILLTITNGLNDDSANFTDLAQFYIQFVGYMGIALLELYMFCWLSELINTAHLKVAEKVYESDWYTRLGSEEKRLVLTLQVAQKGATFTAFRLVKINLKAFTEVLRLSYSFFTILKKGIKTKS